MRHLASLAGALALLLAAGAASAQVADQKALTLEAAKRVVVDGQPAQEVAGALGMQVGTVHTAKCRVLKYLREEFAELLT